MKTLIKSIWPKPVFFLSLFSAVFYFGCTDNDIHQTADIIYLDGLGDSDKIVKLLPPIATNNQEGEVVRLYLVSKNQDNRNLWASWNLSIGDTTRINFIVSPDQKQDLNVNWPDIRKHIILVR